MSGIQEKSRSFRNFSQGFLVEVEEAELLVVEPEPSGPGYGGAEGVGPVESEPGLGVAGLAEALSLGIWLGAKPVACA